MSTQDQETGGNSTIFPDLTFFDINLGDERGKDFPLSQWSISSLIQLQGKLETYLLQRSRQYQNKLIWDQIPGHVVVEMYNSVFGHDSWSTEILDVEVISKTESPNFNTDIKGENSDTVFSLAVEMTLRIKLKDGTYHDETAQGKVSNYTVKSQAFNNCRKIAYTNCVKSSVFEFKRILLEYEELVRTGEVIDHNKL